jgi:hypothetical protein
MKDGVNRRRLLTAGAALPAALPLGAAVEVDAIVAIRP